MQKRSRPPNYREVPSLILSDGDKSSDNTATSSSIHSQKKKGIFAFHPSINLYSKQAIQKNGTMLVQDNAQDVPYGFI